MVFPVLEIRIQLGHVLQIFFDLQLLRDTVSAERNGVIRVIFYGLPVAVNRFLNACDICHFQRIIQSLQGGIVNIGQTDAIQFQLLLNDVLFQGDLVADILHRLFFNNSRDIIDVSIQDGLRIVSCRGSEAQCPGNKRRFIRVFSLSVIHRFHSV